MADQQKSNQFQPINDKLFANNPMYNPIASPFPELNNSQQVTNPSTMIIGTITKPPNLPFMPPTGSGLLKFPPPPLPHGLGNQFNPINSQKLPQPISQLPLPNIETQFKPQQDGKDKEIAQLQVKLKTSEEQEKKLKEEKEDLEKQNLKYYSKVQVLSNEVEQYKSQLLQMQSSQPGQFNAKPDEVTKLNKKIEDQNKQIQELVEKLSSAEEQLGQYQRDVWEQKRQNQQLQDENQNKTQQIEASKKTNESCNRQIETLKKALQQAGPVDNSNQYQQQFQYEEQVKRLNLDISQLTQKNQQLEQINRNHSAEIQELQKSLDQSNKILKETREQLRQAEAGKIELQGEIIKQQQQIESYKFQMSEISTRVEYEKFRDNQRICYEDLNKMLPGQSTFQKNQWEIPLSDEQQMQYQQEKLQKINQENIQKQLQLNMIGKEKQRALIAKSGKIQCLYITDFPKNGGVYQQSIIQSIKVCCGEIKKTTNRDSVWGAISYGAQQPGTTTFHFNQNPAKLENFLFQQSNVKIKFEDKPEDLKQALLEAAQMQWTEKIKLAVILSTSPCHGKQYHDLSKYKCWYKFWGEVKYDTKPQDNIEGAIQQLIEKNIVLLGIRYKEDTQVMYNEFEKIYKKFGRLDLFFTLQIKNIKDHGEIVEQISKMAKHLSGVNIQSTKTKVNQNQRLANFQPGIQDMQEIKREVVQQTDEFQKEAQGKETNKQYLPDISTEKAKQDQIQYEEDAKQLQECKDGALEALCKRGDFSDFAHRVKIKQFQCNAYRVEFQNDAFENKKKKIHEIKEQDFICHKENTWTCIRTDAPFAFGMMKKVYIMQKQGATDELYVVKVPIKTGPYKSMKEAINDCRAHLISKALMNEFINKIKQKPENSKYPDVVYTDFLILEESEQNGGLNYWLAEKFFKGDFQKYNNNDGFVSEDDTHLNGLAQAFSYYTYQVSEFNYIVNDVQGVGKYFTDPAINTVDGNFDDTDGGEEGIGNYLTTLQMRKHICRNLLLSIGIEMD